MPWVKPVQPSEMADAAHELNGSGRFRRQWNIWTEPKEQDAAAERTELSLGKALKWVEEQSLQHELSGKGLNDLVVVAGSLYLVADLYRILDNNK